MIIISTDDFENELNAILDFIAQDSLERAVKFHSDIYAKIKKIPDMPRVYPQNTEANDENVQNLVSKGCIIVFRIAEKQIKILGIFKNNKYKFSAS